MGLDSTLVGEEDGGPIGQFLVESLTAQSLDLPPQVTPHAHAVSLQLQLLQIPGHLGTNLVGLNAFS